MRLIASTLALAAASPAFAEVTIVADMPATAAIARAVVGDAGTVESLVDGTTSAHDFTLRPSQARSIQDANLLIWIGHSLTPWLEDASESRELPSLELLEVAGTHLSSGDEHDHGDHDDHGEEEHAEGEDHDHDDHGDEHADKDDDHDHDHDEEHAEKDDDHDHDHGEEHAEKDDDHGDDHAGHDHHDHGGVDPHAWLDPENAAVWATALAVELSQIDPENAATFIANAVALGEEMEAVEADLEARFEAIDTTIYTYHNALGYMAELGLDVEETLSGYDGTAPGPSTLRTIREDMVAHGLEGTPCLLTDPEAPVAMIEALENDTGVTVVSIAPTGLDGQTYAEIVGAIASAVEACVAN